MAEKKCAAAASPGDGICGDGGKNSTASSESSMVRRAWPLDRVKVNGSYGVQAILDGQTLATVAIPGHSAVGAATAAGLYDPRALAPTFVCGSAIADECPHGLVAAETWHCPEPHGSADCYSGQGKHVTLELPGIYQWSEHTITRWNPPDSVADTMAMLTSAALLLILLYLPSAKRPLIKNWATAAVVLHATSGGSAVEAALYAAGAAASAVAVMADKKKSGVRLAIAAALVRHVPPTALGQRSAQYAKFFMALAVLAECHTAVLPGGVLGAALTVDALFPLLYAPDAVVLAASLFVGGWIAGHRRAV